MNKLFSRMLKDHTPPMNEDVMNGLAVKALKHLEEYLDAQIRSICVGMPPAVRYVRYEHCSPRDEFEEITRLRSNRRHFNLAKSTVYMNRYVFEYTDELGVVHEIAKHIYLPFVYDGGLMMIGGTETHLVPVLSDKVFTANSRGEHASIFVRLDQDKNNFFRLYHTIVLNDHRETHCVTHAEIYRNSAKGRSATAREVTTKAKTVLTHYLFGQYGFTGAFQRYANVVPVVGTDDTITPELYDPEEWIICSSTKVQPSKSNIDKYYAPTNIRLAVPKAAWNHQVCCLVTGFFYVVDHFPSRFSVAAPQAGMAEALPMNNEKMAVINSNLQAVVDDRSLWMILIGHIRFSGNYPENKLYSSIREHFETIEPYLDQAAKDKLAESGIVLENYFDLLNYIQVMFNDFIRNNDSTGLSIYGKNLELYHYVVYDILYGITMMKFKLNKVATRGNITLNDVETHIRRVIRMGAIFDLASGNKIVSEVVGYSGDHKYPKITSIVAQQESRSGGNRDTEKRIVPGPEHWLDLSMVTTGSILNLPKANPTPVVRVNPWIKLDECTNTVLADPKFTDLIEANKPLFNL